MRIAIVLGPFQPLPPDGIGAVEKVWCELGRMFAAKGHQVTIIGCGASGVLGRQLQNGVEIRYVRGLDPSGRTPLDLLKDLTYAVRVAPVIPPSDIVVTNSFWTPVVLAPFKRWKGRIVVHVARFPKGQMWMYRGADALQAISSAVARAIRQQAPSVGSKVRVLGYPVDLSIFSPRAMEEGADAGRTIVYVGRVHPEKGVHLLIEAFRNVSARVTGAQLVIVGPHAKKSGGGGDAYRRQLESAAAGIAVTFRGAIADRADLAAAYRRAACFCYPSVAERGEALGLAVLEAMAAGLPCVVSALECFQDFARHGENALVFDHRSASAAGILADTICSVLNDAESSLRLGRAARATAERYSLERIADEYLSMFDSVLACRRTN